MGSVFEDNGKVDSREGRRLVGWLQPFRFSPTSHCRFHSFVCNRRDSFFVVSHSLSFHEPITLFLRYYGRLHVICLRQLVKYSLGGWPEAGSGLSTKTKCWRERSEMLYRYKSRRSAFRPSATLRIVFLVQPMEASALPILEVVTGTPNSSCRKFTISY